MSDIPKYFIGILIGILIIGGAVMLFSHPSSDTANVTDDSSLSNAVQEQVDTISNGVNSTISNVTNNGISNTTTASNGSGALQSSQNGVTGGQVQHNYQEGNSDYYEIKYADGNVRQYDTKTGELIGSTFDEDQEKLGNLNGDLE